MTATRWTLKREKQLNPYVFEYYVMCGDTVITHLSRGCTEADAALIVSAPELKELNDWRNDCDAAEIAGIGDALNGCPRTPPEDADNSFGLSFCYGMGYDRILDEAHADALIEDGERRLAAAQAREAELREALEAMLEGHTYYGEEAGGTYLLCCSCNGFVAFPGQSGTQHAPGCPVPIARAALGGNS